MVDKLKIITEDQIFINERYVAKGNGLLTEFDLTN